MKVVGIFRGFPGLGRVVSGLSIIETLKSVYNWETYVVSYLQGAKYMDAKGFECQLSLVSPMDYCSIGLLPTNRMGSQIHSLIKNVNPDLVIIDGEPLMVQALRVSYPDLKIVVLLNPSDVDNPSVDIEIMDYFNSLYSLSDLAIVHGLRAVSSKYKYKKLLSIGTILRPEILNIVNDSRKDVYCVLGGGTINVGEQFVANTISIANLCISVASVFSAYNIHIVCSSKNISDMIGIRNLPENVYVYDRLIMPNEYYSKANLIITRSGRNTLSELAYLGIPAISFVTGDVYRKSEQEQNLKNLNVANIVACSVDVPVSDFMQMIKKQLDLGRQSNQFVCGNDEAIEAILRLVI